MTCDGIDIKYFLKRRGYSLSDVARQIDRTPQHVFNVIMGVYKSQLVVGRIEKLLDMESGTLKISPRAKSSMVEVA